MIKLEKVTMDKEEILHNIMQFYIYEFGKYHSWLELEQNGSYKRFNLDKYWTDSNFHAYFINREEELIGFALVQSETATSPNSIDEFFIISKYHRKGSGKMAATQIFNLFQGKWVVSQIEKNYPAQAFWRGLIHEITGDKMEERYENRNSVQEFHTDSF